MATWTHDFEICLLWALFASRTGLLKWWIKQAKYLVSRYGDLCTVFRQLQAWAWPVNGIPIATTVAMNASED